MKNPNDVVDTVEEAVRVEKAILRTIDEILKHVYRDPELKPEIGRDIRAKVIAMLKEGIKVKNPNNAVLVHEAIAKKIDKIIEPFNKEEIRPVISGQVRNSLIVILKAVIKVTKANKPNNVVETVKEVMVSKIDDILDPLQQKCQRTIGIVRSKLLVMLTQEIDTNILNRVVDTAEEVVMLKQEIKTNNPNIAVGQVEESAAVKKIADILEPLYKIKIPESKLNLFVNSSVNQQKE